LIYKKKKKKRLEFDDSGKGTLAICNGYRHLTPFVGIYRPQRHQH